MRLLIFICVVLSVFSSTAKAQTYIDYFNKGVLAYQNSDYPGFLKATQQADSSRPNHYVILYNLAHAYTLNGEFDKAIKTLDYRSHFYAEKDFVVDEYLKPLFTDEGWEILMRSIEEINKTQLNAERVFSIDKKGFHPEDILYHKEKNKFFLADVRSGTISSIDLNGENLKQILSLKDFGYWSAFGLKVDSVNPDHLWVTTAAVPNFIDYKEEDKGKSALLLIDLKTSALLERFEMYDGQSHLGDLIIDGNGTVYVTDSGEVPAVYMLNRSTKQLEEFISHNKWWNLQGLVLSDDQNNIYVSDYITGIYKIDLRSKEVSPLLKNNEWLRGGDGIYIKDDRLIVLQNGTFPKRLATIRLDSTGLGIIDTLDFPHNATQELEEPTLGTWVNDEFYYIANSPWGYYDQYYNPKLDEWPKIHIYKL